MKSPFFNLFFAVLFGLMAILSLWSCSKKSTKAPGVNPGDSTGTGTGNMGAGTTDVYICGSTYYSGKSIGGACYWKNGVEVDLPSDEMAANANAIAVSDTNVYVVGRVDTSACVWINGKLMNIGGGENSSAMGVKAVHDTVYINFGATVGVGPAPNVVVASVVLILYPNGGYSSFNDVGNYGHPYAGGIDVAGGQVYTAGSNVFSDKYLYGQPVYELSPVYWKNGSLVNLPYPAPYAMMQGTTSAIFVSGTDVYTAGAEAFSPDSTSYFDNYDLPVYWKNQTAVELDAPSGIGAASGIAVSGTDVYVSGYEYSGGNYEPCFWKNGTVNWLGRTSFAGYANSIALSGSDVYCAGYEIINPDPNNSNEAYIAAEWKNGSETLLSPTATSSVANGVFVVAH